MAFAAVVLAMVLAGCGPGSADVGHGRRGSWRQIEDPLFTTEASHGIAGLVAPW